ncbi:hypothetical protein [uncultured Dysosmobacter sp.]|uniref:hypothetical protein n=1 Tax=uncultured Dysosmobacter sp. TaxID=2591384 RepID=UPI00262890F4|nr:hypothetical protein [uncultured Dysosmobacter sp.]
MSEAMKISINNGIKKIEVNDRGEYILLPVGDDTFIKRFYSLAKETQRKAAEIKTDTADVVATMDDIIELDKDLKARVDGLFGADTCRKVFGDMTPGVAAFMEFFAQISNILKEYMTKEVREQVSRYTRG